MYQVFARKYRPQNFEEVVGQTVACQTLKNIINQKRFHHATLFCGARGVGKTSMARILAKSLNCEKGPTVTPCQECASCRGITASTDLDVLEIDGASNTSVDDVRALREQAKFLPSGGKYKIYIIDEVHMLSQSAFNALLKILEEPPPHVLFIFATTEPHKIPVTILSRCQRFDFRRLSEPELVTHLQNILAQEKLSIDEESLLIVSQAGDGSVRDSLSLLDQVISFCGKDVTPEKVRSLLGLASRMVLFETLEALLNNQAEKVLSQISLLFENGQDLKIFAENLLELLRHTLVMKEGGEKFVVLPSSEKEKLKSISAQTEPVRLIMLFQILFKAAEEMARTPLNRLVLETALLKMVHVGELVAVSELVQGANPPQPPLIRGVPAAGDSGRPVETRFIASQSGLSPSPSIPFDKLRTSPPSSREREVIRREENNGDKTWLGFVKDVITQKPQLGSLLEQGYFLEKTGSTIKVGFEPKSLYGDMFKDRQNALTDLASSYFNEKISWTMVTLTDEDKKTAQHALSLRTEADAKRRQEIKTKVETNPMIQKAQSILGATIQEIKI